MPAPDFWSQYVAARDGTLLAVDVYLPSAAGPAARVTTALRGTRYWREFNLVPPERDSRRLERELLLAAGFAVVVCDVRGSGASFGTWDGLCSAAEIHDMADIIGWIAEQPWSDGSVITHGESYDANIAELTAGQHLAAVRAAVVRFPDLDLFGDLFWPGGIASRWFPGDWSALTRALDGLSGRGEGLEVAGLDLVATASQGAKPVDEDRRGVRLAQAVAAHAGNLDLAECLRGVEFRDDPGAVAAGLAAADGGFSTPSRDLVTDAVMYMVAGWWDAATVRGVIRRFLTRSHPIRIVIGPWSHGGLSPGAPGIGAGHPVEPPIEAQIQDAIGFMKQRRRGEPAGPSSIRYYTFGADSWSETRCWPPEGSKTVRLHLSEGGQLRADGPAARAGMDRIDVDFLATTGTFSRWHTQVNSGQVRYPDMAAHASRGLCYTGAPLAGDIVVTGSPVVWLWLASDRDDFAAYAYLELVDRDERVHLITEGQLRAGCRKVIPDPDGVSALGPHLSLRRHDALPVRPGELVPLNFALIPTSFLARRGDRIRLVVTGHDAGNFARIPAFRSARLSLARGAEHPSWLDMPVIALDGYTTTASETGPI